MVNELSQPAIATHCPYCALQCGMRLSARNGEISVEGNADFPVNNGALCIKGWTSAETLHHPERLTMPLARNRHGQLEPVSWNEALRRTAFGLYEAQLAHGRDAAGVFGSGALTNEKAYLLGKFARVALGTANIDYNGRFCMSSAAAAANKAFGIDRGLPFPVADIADAEAILLVGSNTAETMPPIMQYFDAQRRNGGKLIVADPRLSPTAQTASVHLRLTPGSDAALANGLMHLLVRDGLIDREFIQNHTESFEQVRSLAASYWPERVERITGVPEAQLIAAARLLGEAKTAMILTGRGPEQQAQGTNNGLAFINIALALGLAGKPASGYGTLTGQGNGQGGREHGQKADQLPGYRKIDDTAAREHIAAIWDISEQELPKAGLSAYEMLDTAGQPDGVRALLVMGANVAVSSPRAGRIKERLRKLDFLAVADFFLSETAELADVVLPGAQWAEEEGTMTNLEGRVILRRRAIAPPAGVMTDLEVLCHLAALLGHEGRFAFESPREVFDELRRASASGIADYSGITYEKIEEQNGVFWPCPAPCPNDHAGTPRLFANGRFPTPSGRARFHAVQHQAPAEEPTERFPLYLTTGRLLSQYQSGTQTRRIEKLLKITPEPLAELHPMTARHYGLSAGDKIWIETRRDAAKFKIKVTPNIREDTVFVPFHWGGAQAVNRLTNPALDPISRMPEFKICAARISKVVEE
ncbi:MAG: molybdopterin oxidoreductase family protein [Acidobacteriota bacterium]